MKKALLILFILPMISFGQTDIITNESVAKNSGNILVNYKPDTKGTPYLYDEWKTGYIVINDSIINPQERIQLDLTNNELIIGAGKSKETGVVITDKSITGFAIIEDINTTQKVFFAKVNSSNFEDSNRSIKFYEVISNLENNNYLIKEETKYLFDPNKSRGYQTQNSIPQEWKVKTSYYIKGKSGKYMKTKLSKKSILKKLGDKNTELKAYVNSKKIKFSKDQDVARLLNYYHSL
jgi:hypothetical protein